MPKAYMYSCTCRNEAFIARKYCNKVFAHTQIRYSHTDAQIRYSHTDAELRYFLHTDAEVRYVWSYEEQFFSHRLRKEIRRGQQKPKSGICTQMHVSKSSIRTQMPNSGIFAYSEIFPQSKAITGRGGTGFGYMLKSWW